MPRYNNHRNPRQRPNVHTFQNTHKPTAPKFTVHINEGEKQQIEKWVLMKDNIETGGDLFGLWITGKTAVVQFVLGPGENCRRSPTSFYQDIEYLRKAGNYLTQEHGLCNIGQWHSHHRLSLTRPSGGDENTVWGNMPNLGLNRYIVFIATISGHGRNEKVNINPYLFEISHNGSQLPVARGTLEVLKEKESPFRANGAVLDFIMNGREVELQDVEKASVKLTEKITRQENPKSYPPFLHISYYSLHVEPAIRYTYFKFLPLLKIKKR